ncbi:MAG TPA: ROK family protein [Spirochaetia bacterium]|nr:ROK family protein [Spirochaetia bacterium]
MEPVLAAVDIGGTKVTASVARREGILAKVYQPTVRTGDIRALPRQVDYLLGYACERVKVDKTSIKALGISTCSPFKKKNGYLSLLCPNICGGLAKERGILPNDWIEVPLEEELRKHFRKVKIGNDCVTAVAAERIFGAGQGEKNMIYVTWSTGIGAGAYVGGKLLLGKNSNAMHLGHTFISWVDEGQPQCGCGDYGHLEAFAAGPALEREYGEPPVEAFRKYREGEPRAMAVIGKAVRIFARGLANATSLLDPALIVIGGSVARDWDVLEPLIKHEYYSCFPPLTEGVRIVRSALDRFLGDIAALSLVMPKKWIELWKVERPWENPPDTVNLDAS